MSDSATGPNESGRSAPGVPRPSAPRRAADWVRHRPGYMLFLARDVELAAADPNRFHRAWVGVMAFSLIWGFLLVNVWGLAWMLFRDFGVIIMPALMTAGVFVLWPYRRGVTALSRVGGGREPATRSLVASLVLVTLLMGFVRMNTDPVYGEPALPDWIAWIRPDHELYRVLLLMPLWGGWSMLIVGQFCRPCRRTEPAVAALYRGCGPAVAAGVMGAVLTATVLYFSFLPWWQLGISAGAIVVAVAGGWALCRATGGLRRRTLLATNVVTQLGLLLGYLANR